jgi:small subunit ribosomal protein S21
MKNWNNNRPTNDHQNPNRKHAQTVDSTEITLRGTRVEVRNNDVNYALRKMKKILERENFQKELAKHEYFEKASMKRKRERAAAEKRWEKEMEKLRLLGVWHDSTSKCTKYMKSKRKRRIKMDRAVALLQEHRRKKV